MLRLLIATLLLINVGFADVIYNEIKSLETTALRQADGYMADITQNVANIQKEINANINKKDFLKQQQKQLKSAFDTQGKPNNNTGLLVFVSFSMPHAALKSLLVESKKYNATLVMQGLVENSLPKTIVKINNLIKEANNDGGMQIDPNLFNQYKIKNVPAIVIRDEEAFDVIYGLGSIKESLYVFYDKKGVMANKAARLLNNA